MTRDKGPDEIFCSSCGEPIKKAAKICPECGVPNNKKTTSGVQKTSSNTSVSHDPSDYETTVGDNWYYALILPSALFCRRLLIQSLLG
jgi:ribosomal protein L37E